MRGLKPSLALATAGVIGLALWAGAVVEGTGGAMASAAQRFLASLDAEQRDQVTFPFDDPERLDWHYIPRERNGLAIRDMDSAQRALAFGLIQTGLSGSGYLKATTIMSLEQILRDMEGDTEGLRRNPELYYITIFGDPSNRGRWGWRVEGHHLSVNIALEDGQIISATPVFFGANPAEVRQGSRQGLRTLADYEDRALRLLQALDENQQQAAIVADQAPGDIRDGGSPQPPTEAPVGIPFTRLNDDQRAMLRALVESYAADMPREVGEAWLQEIRRDGPDGIHFAWFGPPDRNQPHAYRVQGPTFLIEFNNTQNNANHIHSVWRSMLGDFGVPITE